MPSGRYASSRIGSPPAKLIADITDLRGTAFVRSAVPKEWVEIDSTHLDAPGALAPPIDPYAITPAAIAGAARTGAAATAAPSVRFIRDVKNSQREKSVIRMPSCEAVSADPVLYAHASRILHLESNPGNARALVQRHGSVDVWLNPPPIPLTTKEMDWVYELPYQRRPHPAYGTEVIPAYKMIRFSISIQRGCFGGCTFCSITEHEGRIIQNRSEESVLREIGRVRDSVPGFTGVISDLGGPTANMYRLACKSPRDRKRLPPAVVRISRDLPESQHRSCAAHPPVSACARKLPGIKKVLIASGVRYDLAVESPAYVKELAQHHTGGYLKIAPEALADGPLSKMMKPGVGAYYNFKELFDALLQGSGQGAVPHSLFHRGASGHER